MGNTASILNMLRKIGVEAEISLEEGLIKTIDWAKKNHIEYLDAFTGYKTA